MSGKEKAGCCVGFGNISLGPHSLESSCMAGQGNGVLKGPWAVRSLGWGQGEHTVSYLVAGSRGRGRHLPHSASQLGGQEGRAVSARGQEG